MKVADVQWQSERDGRSVLRRRSVVRRGLPRAWEAERDVLGAFERDDIWYEGVAGPDRKLKQRAKDEARVSGFVPKATGGSTDGKDGLAMQARPTFPALLSCSRQGQQPASSALL